MRWLIDAGLVAMAVVALGLVALAAYGLFGG
jgi:hypothetical protein